MSLHPTNDSYRTEEPLSEWCKRFLEDLESIDSAATPPQKSPRVREAQVTALDPKVGKPCHHLRSELDPEWAEILAEDALPLKERFPDEFARYKHWFYDFCRKSPFHIKKSYKSGFVARRQRRRKDGTRYSPYCYDDLLARHLDPERWLLCHPDEFPIDQPDNHWLALRCGKRTMLGCIDFDNKQNVIGCYNTCMVGSDPARPLPVLTLEHVQNIKRLYDMFPSRIWCVSSATLGLHIWEKLPRLHSHRQVEVRYRPKLRRIGLSNVEVYPSPQLSNQVLRRPFGEDYFTITDDGLLSDWVEQLEYFEQPGNPKFASIVSGLAELATIEWRRYDRYNGLFLTKTSMNSVKLENKPHLRRFVYEDMAVPAEFLQELRRIRKWLDTGCPEVTQDTALRSGYSCINKDSGTPEIAAQIEEPTGKSTRKWVEACVGWATNGLPGEDSLFQVINDLARWFYFVEFFDHPEGYRIDKTTDLLQHFALTKHNDYITTLNSGHEGEVENRVRRIVRRSIQTSTKQDLFLRIRENRKNGRYVEGNFMLEPVIRGQVDSPLGSGYTCINKEIDDTPLPDSIHRRLIKIVTVENMRQRGGEYPLIRFSRRLLNALWNAGGEARIKRDTICAFLGYKNFKQQLEYKRLLAKHRLIYPGWENYVVQKKLCALYRLTKPAAKVFEMRDNAEAKSAQSP